MPAGVGLVSDSVLFEGSAELIAAEFISAPIAGPVTDAKTRPTKMHLRGKSIMPAGPLFRHPDNGPIGRRYTPAMVAAGSHPDHF
jgi:hypothetical protein